MRLRALWKCALMVFGEQCVTAHGVTVKQLSFADRLDSSVKVCFGVYCAAVRLPLLGAFTQTGLKFERLTGPFHFDDLMCSGNESDILQCAFSSGSCIQRTKIGIQCFG